jgi:phage head maturation protease
MMLGMKMITVNDFMKGEKFKMRPTGYDFCGWVTKNNVLCSDGRTIMKDAFAHQDGMKVPTVFMHDHETTDGICGYTILENRPEGVYGYTYCNNTNSGKNIKEAVRHGDIDSYSIYANQLKEKASKVVHGVIKEVSVVLTGANAGAKIEEVSMAHYDETGENIEYDAIIVTGDSELEISHSEEGEKKMKESKESDNKTIGDVLDTLTDEQKEAVAITIGMAVEDAMNGEFDDEIDDEDDHEDDDYDEDEEDDYDDDDVEHSDYYNEGEYDMRTNVFDMDSTCDGGVLSHSDVNQIFKDAKSGRGTLKEVYEDATALMHADDDEAHGISRSEDRQNYGVNDPSFLFPEARELNNTPEWIKRPDDWVTVVMNGVHHTPFSRVKTQFADITEDAARAKGYIKGNRKKEEVFTLLKRTTTPQTIYKLQKLDRDDIIDITDFDVVAWIKGEMRMMLNEEIARAILIGDGRSTADNDHISEDHVRPIWSDASLFTIRRTIDISDPKNIIDAAVRARKEYRGSGNPIMFTTEDHLTDMLLMEDGIKHKLYKTEAELATAMRVSRIVTVPVMENQTKDGKTLDAIIVNLNDYKVGADKGGSINMFEDFDIDYNQEKYLIETRISGCLVKPFSAIVLETSAQG